MVNQLIIKMNKKKFQLKRPVAGNYLIQTEAAGGSCLV